MTADEKMLKSGQALTEMHLWAQQRENERLRAFMDAMHNRNGRPWRRPTMWERVKGWWYWQRVRIAELIYRLADRIDP